jgi:integrase/recombinase XerD
MSTQKISCLARIRPGETSNSFGIVGSVIIQVTIDSKPDRIPISMAWPVNCFDEDKEILTPRYQNDEECYQNNLVLSMEKLKAQRLSLELYVAGIQVTTKEFKRRFNSFKSREDFIDYMLAKRLELFQSGEVSEGTYKKYLTVIHRLQDFCTGGKKEYSKHDLWKFNTVGYNNVKNFEIWLINKKDAMGKSLGHNTMVGTIKIIHKFFNCAKLDGINFKDPMDGYPIPSFTPGVREALNLEELKALKQFYLNGGFSEHEKDVLERYLVSCFTGLRKSDIEQLDTRIHIRSGRLRLKMIKTRKYNKDVEFKLPDFVLQIIGNRRGRLFLPMESALLNKTLRKMIDRMNSESLHIEGAVIIEKYLKFHSGRDTFATNFLRLRGMLAVLKDILGHSTITMTEIYVKMAFDEADETMDQFNTI